MTLRFALPRKLTLMKSILKVTYTSIIELIKSFATTFKISMKLLYINHIVKLVGLVLISIKPVHHLDNVITAWSDKKQIKKLSLGCGKASQPFLKRLGLLFGNRLGYAKDHCVKISEVELFLQMDYNDTPKP